MSEAEIALRFTVLEIQHILMALRDNDAAGTYAGPLGKWNKRSESLQNRLYAALAELEGIK